MGEFFSFSDLFGLGGKNVKKTLDSILWYRVYINNKWIKNLQLEDWQNL